MSKNDRKIIKGVILISVLLGAYTLMKVMLIKKGPIYILASITRVTHAQQTSIGYEFFYQGKKYNGSMHASGLGVKVGDYYMIQFQKSNPNNCRPLFSKDNWRCLLNDSSYYYGSPKKPDCAY